MTNKQTKTLPIPLPLFDTIASIKQAQLSEHIHIDFAHQDFQPAVSFLREYDGNQATFNSYRREVERLLQWSWLIRKTSILFLKREDIELYLDFCQKPPSSWIGVAKVPRYIEKESQRIPNPAWRPFVATVSKEATKKGLQPDINQHKLSEKAVREIFAVLSSFYNFLIQEKYTQINPLLQIRQKTKYFRKRQRSQVVRRLSELQWDTVIETAHQLAAKNPLQHERTLFIMSILYAMYLRISELVASERWIPKMCDFRRNHDGHWWFTTVGKGNKERQIAVSDAMLNALKRWRKHLGMKELPAIDDQTPLIPKINSKGPIESTNQIRNIVQYCFDQAIEKLKRDGFMDEANGLQSATVHWLRHTGISDDIKYRPREHVRDDAGHSSSATTDKYIDIDLRERYASARRKQINKDKE